MVDWSGQMTRHLFGIRNFLGLESGKMAGLKAGESRGERI